MSWDASKSGQATGIWRKVFLGAVPNLPSVFLSFLPFLVALDDFIKLS